MGANQDRQRQLEANIRRVHEAIARGQGVQDPLVRSVLGNISERINERISDKMQRKEARWKRREERRRGRREHGVPNKPQGFVYGGASLVMVLFAVIRPDLWWLLFVAFGLAMSAAQTLVRAYRIEARQAELPDQDSEDAGEVPEAGEARAAENPQAADPLVAQLQARLTRVDGVCEKLLSELKAAPQVVRDFVQKPEETVKALRAACHEMARREGELRAAITAEDDQRLRKEREELEARVAAEKDGVVRGRLESALKALDAQLAQRAELATAASRFEAEGTRILYTLENLRTQVLRARSADAASADVAGTGLRQSLEQIGQEIDAVAGALEEVNTEGSKPQPIADISPEGGESGRPTRERV